MELFPKTQIDFLGKRVWCLTLSGLLMAAAIVSLLSGVNKGIDFTGGTEVQVKFAEPPDLDRLRAALAGRPIGEPTIQSIGRAEDHELLIRAGVPRGRKTREPGEMPLAQEEQSRIQREVEATLREVMGVAGEARVDLNSAGESELSSLLAARSGGAEAAASHAKAIIDYRRTHAGLIRSFDELSRIPGLVPETIDHLKQHAVLGKFTIRRAEYVGPRVGKELAHKAYLAMVFSIAGILGYVWFRFRNLAFALGGIVALAHDGVIAAGVFNMIGGQFDLTIVAAVLTLLGYSINDTIVIFDRVRENLRTLRGTDLVQVMNDAINQTLSRTILTSLLTLFVVVSLYLFGGDTLHGFAFVLLFGMLIGSYSTVFIASPVVIYWERWMGRRRAASPGARPVAGTSAGSRSTAAGPSRRRTAGGR